MLDLAISEAKKLAKVFEGFSQKPYLCPAGIWTIGFGTTRYPNGKQVTKDDPPISREEAEVFLEQELIRQAKISVLYCPVLAQHPYKLAAIIDFCYNLGPGRLKYSTLRRKVNEQDWSGAKAELMKWVYAGGKKLNGLVSRRVAEAKLFDL
jgi:lysozyme